MPGTFWRRVALTEDERQLNHSIATFWLGGGLFLFKLLGDAVVGLVALEAFYSKTSKEVTAEYVAERLGDRMSEDTVRRRLKKMAEMNVLQVRKAGRTMFYQLHPDLAATAITLMRGEVVFLP